MLNGISSNMLLRSVIAIMATATVVLLACNAWQAWRQLGQIDRISSVAEVSSLMFKAMHELRTDRATTGRSLVAEQPISPEMERYLGNARDTQMPALAGAVALLPALDFQDAKTLVPQFQAIHTTLLTLEKESWDALHQPKSARRASLAKEHWDAETNLLDLLDQISLRLDASIKHRDPVIDELIEMKGLAWDARNAGGDASLLVSKGLAAGAAQPDALRRYAGYLAASEADWAQLETLSFGTELPPKLRDAITDVKQNYF